MRAGQAKHKVTFQQATETINGSNETIQAWGRFKVLMCRLVPLEGREREIAMQTYGDVTHRMETTWTPGLTSKMRAITGAIQDDGEPGVGARLFQIEAAINVDERNRDLFVFCTQAT